MSSLLEDDTRYVKLWLLLVKGGTYVFKKHTQKILDKDNTTIDVSLKPHRDKLSEKKNIYPKLWELLCSNSGQPKDIDVLDISAYAYVLLNIFDKRLDPKEKTAISELRDKRNELVHRGVSSLSEIDFHREWNQLMTVLCKLSYTLSSNDEDNVKKLMADICAIRDIHRATYELKSFEKQDDFVKDVLAEKQCVQERRLDVLTKDLCEQEKRIRNIENQLEISARITVSSSTQTACDAAHQKLFDAAKCCHTGGHVNQEEDKVFTACNNMFTDMSKDGANIKNVEEGSVLITFSCSTLTSLKSAFLYLTKTVYIKRLQELEKALSQSIGCCVRVNVNIILESLISTLGKEEHCTSDKSVVFTVSCIGSKGVRSVCDNLINGSSTNTVNNVAEALSTSVGQRIELHRTIDLDKLANEISLLERRHGDHGVQRSLSKSAHPFIHLRDISPEIKADASPDQSNKVTSKFTFAYRKQAVLSSTLSATTLPTKQKKIIAKQSRTMTSRFTSTDRTQSVPSSTLSVYNSSVEASVRLSDSTTSKQHTPLDPSTLPPTTSLASLDIQHGSDFDDTPFQDESSFNKYIKVKLDSDSKNCLIVSMTSISDHEVVVCDNINKSVKMINIDNDVISGNITFSTVPFDITSLSNGDVAVTFPGEHVIKIFTTLEGLNIKETIKTGGRCLAVDYLNDEMYVSYKDPVKFRILSMSGDVRKSIIPDSKCLEYISFPRYIAVNITDTTSIIYISDWTKNVIVSIDLNGAMLAVYKDESLVKPHDITITPFGSIYLCNSDKDIIYKMSEDLTEGLMILGPRDGLVAPCSMCFCPGRKSLLISGRFDARQYCNFIKQFKYN